MSILFRLLCLTLGMGALVVGVYIDGNGLVAAGSMLFAWTIGYGWGEANAYYDWIEAMRRSQP